MQFPSITSPTSYQTTHPLKLGFFSGRASISLWSDFLPRFNGQNWVVTPIGISFVCARNRSCIEGDIYNIFIRALQKKAHEDIENNSGQFCNHAQVTGGCGNRRGALSECRCEMLNRKSVPEIRSHYEDRVIDKIIELIKDQGNIKCFEIKLAIFCSGGLLGEEILLFRLFDRLRPLEASGVIKLFLIDHCYAAAIHNSLIFHSQITNEPFAFVKAVGNAKDIGQFLEDIAKTVQPDIQVEGTFFSDGDHYIERTKIDDSFKHQLIIGADIENSNIQMGRIATQARLGSAQPITLVKTEKPLMCSLDPIGNLTQCYTPIQSSDTTPTSANISQKQGGCIIA